MLRNAIRTLIRKRGPYSSLTRLLISRREFERAVAKERVRCDRHDLSFGMIVFQLSCPTNRYASQIRALARILHRRLRITDEKAQTNHNEVAVLLPHTDKVGAQILLENITGLAAVKEIYFHAEILVYPGNRNGLDAPWNDEDSDGANSFRTEERDSSTEREELSPFYPAQSLNRSMGFKEEGIAAPMFSPRYPVWKRGVDVVGAVAGLIVSAPLLLTAAAAIKMSSPGPVLFSQMRMGYHGTRFTIWKLRTMVPDAHELQIVLKKHNERDGPAFKMKNDPRVTKIGRLLRSTGIDELPQLWNVLKGEMAIVGPRPLPCDEDLQCHSWQRRRLDTKPGITCTWQISKNRQTSFAEWMRMDLRYADHHNCWTDMWLIVRTVKTVVFGRAGD